MRTFKAYFKKEVIESIRHHRYLVLFFGFVLFSILDPIIVKLMPELLKGQVPEELINQIVFNPIEGANNYMKDVFQFTNLIVIMSLMGVINDEISMQKLVFPWSKGARAEGLVLAKFFHYSLVILFSAIVGFMVNTYYVNFLFEGDNIAYWTMLQSALLFTQYFVFTIAFLFFLSSMFKRGVGAAIIVLIFNYFTPMFINVLSWTKWIPHTLVIQANLKNPLDANLLSQVFLITSIYVVVLISLTIRRVRRVEII